MTKERLITLILTADIQNQPEFHGIIKAGVDAGFWDKKWLAHEFGTSYPTAERWINGMNAPHEAIRGAVYKTLIEKLQNS